MCRQLRWNGKAIKQIAFTLQKGQFISAWCLQCVPNALCIQASSLYVAKLEAVDCAKGNINMSAITESAL